MNLDSLLDAEILGTPVRDALTIEFLASLLGDVVAALLILIIGFVLAGWVARKIRGLGERHAHLDETLFGFLGNIARYAILVFAVIVVLNTFGIQTTSLIAAIGAVGLAIGLALQGTLSNVAAGVMIVFFRPIKTGDFVEVNGQMGTVREITLNYTELATPDNVQIIIPNSEVWGNTIKNYSIYDQRRTEWVFGVSYDTDLGKAEQIIMETILADGRGLPDPAPWIQVTNLGESSVDFTVRVWCSASDFWGFRTDMTRQVKEALDEGGIDIPFPTRTVYRVEQDAE